jgi:hypothetical protein
VLHPCNACTIRDRQAEYQLDFAASGTEETRELHLGAALVWHEVKEPDAQHGAVLRWLLQDLDALASQQRR